jgi:hypothetical protein
MLTRPCLPPPSSQPQPHLRFQLTEHVALARREWPLRMRQVRATVKAEAAYWLQVRSAMGTHAWAAQSG